MIARGVMLGPEQPVILHMLDIPPAAEALNGVKMELVDAAFPLLKGTHIPFDIYLVYLDFAHVSLSKFDSLPAMTILSTLPPLWEKYLRHFPFFFLLDFEIPSQAEGKA